MKLVFLLEETEISGRTRAVVAYGDALVARGHQVRIVTPALPLTWRESAAEWVYVDELRTFDASDDDFVIAATPGALAIAEQTAPSRAVQPTGYIVDEEFYRQRERAEHEPLRVLIVGAWPSGVAEAYGAAAHARWFHQKFDLVRISPWAPSREEPLDAVQEFHVALHTREMARVLHSCDLFIAAATSEKTFALSPAEAMAAGLAGVMTATDAHRAYDAAHDYALFAPEGNAVELGEKLIELLSDRELRARLRQRGREVAAALRPERAVLRLEELVGGKARAG